MLSIQNEGFSGDNDFLQEEVTTSKSDKTTGEGKSQQMNQALLLQMMWLLKTFEETESEEESVPPLRISQRIRHGPESWKNTL